jgi:hypothetical protein
MAVNFDEKFKLSDGVDTGLLNGAGPKGLRFGPRASGRDIFTNVILGAYLNAKLGTKGPHSPSSLSPLAGQPLIGALAAQFDSGPAVLAAKRLNAAVKQAKLEYKARPLDGIWATAPYLHNGSVPTIAELLKAPCDRTKQFYVGSHDFDAEHIGLSMDNVAGAFLFDTSKPGNSNQGHPYGTTLTDDQKKALMEYLKKL